jgi:hypothetical protein
VNYKLSIITKLLVLLLILGSCQTEKELLTEDRQFFTEKEKAEGKEAQLPGEDEEKEQADQGIADRSLADSGLKDQRLSDQSPAEEGEKAVSKPADEEKEKNSIIDVITSLEKSYEKKDYDMWRSFLTEGYKRKYNDPEVLKKEGWNAEDLRSFFNLLVRTRTRAHIETLSISRVDFLSQNKALVYVMLEGEEFPEPQHTFIKINNKWYKGLIEEGE